MKLNICRDVFRRKKKRKKQREVEYQVHTKGCDITFKTGDAKHYKHIKLVLVGIAKLLNLVRDNDDWEKFTVLMGAVVEELGAEDIHIVEEPPVKIDYVI